MMKIDENKGVTFVPEAPDVCELCGDKAELRPYGPNRERICAPCGSKDMVTTMRMMNAAMDQALVDHGVSLTEVSRVGFVHSDETEVVLYEVPSPNGDQDV